MEDIKHLRESVPLVHNSIVNINDSLKDRHMFRGMLEILWIYPPRSPMDDQRSLFKF